MIVLRGHGYSRVDSGQDRAVRCSIHPIRQCGEPLMQLGPECDAVGGRRLAAADPRLASHSPVSDFALKGFINSSLTKTINGARLGLVYAKCSVPALVAQVGSRSGTAAEGNPEFRMSSDTASDPRIDLLRPYFTAALRGGSVDELVADSLRKLDEWHGVRIMEAWHKLNASRPQRSAVH